MTIADMAIICALVQYKHNVADLPELIQHYIDYHTSSHLFASAKRILTTLQPPTLPKYNPNDPSLDRAMEAVFAEAILTAFPTLDPSDILPILKVQKCTSVKNGQYQCNSAMPLFAKVKTAYSTLKSPQDVARAIVNAIPSTHPILDANSLTVTGPGFITCTFTSIYLQQWVNNMMSRGIAIPPLNLTAQTVVVDFSSPNIAKEMHVGHLRSTIIGESVCRILEYCGNKVVRMNHIGGTYVCM